MPKNWPITRKGTKYVVKPSFDLEKGIPLLVLLRDFLKVAKTRDEVKKALNAKNIILNGKIAKDDKESLRIFDTIKIIPSNKCYRLSLSNIGKFFLNEIKEEDSKYKISKVVDKKTLKNRKTQLNLIDGRNFITDFKCGTQDSVVFNFNSGKITKLLPLKEKAGILVFAGKHSGKTGTIKKINLEKKTIEMQNENGTFNVLIKQFMVVE
ncbi:hypothetical protein HY212_07025 [Candidatus Pacearchaeota archaeon]|nr:hypothetical protein [Candidatus Pacearchaeota archaeon]